MTNLGGMATWDELRQALVRLLEERLRARSTDSEAVIERRLRDAVQDLAHWTEFDYVVVNDQFERAVADLLAIVQQRGEEFRATGPEIARFAAGLLKFHGAAGNDLGDLAALRVWCLAGGRRRWPMSARASTSWLNDSTCPVAQVMPDQMKRLAAMTCRRLRRSAT